MPARTRIVAALVVAACSTASCSSAGPARDAEQVAVDFHRNLDSDRGAQSCELLAPRTRHQVQGDEGQDCATAITALATPAVQRASSVVVYGRQAMVVFDTDTVFLSRFTAGWKVIAAGCTPMKDLPYDCKVRGG